MILNFPKPFADELVYSLIARYLWLQPSTNLKSAAERAFATKNALAVVDLPARLGALSGAIGDETGMDAQRLIRDHTLLPLYSPFMPAQRLALIEENLTGNGGGTVHFRAGIMASGIRPAFRLRFCPRCVADERAKYGEAYWHRLHQAAGVFICPEHGVFLEESSVPIQFRRTRHLFVPAQDVIPEVPKTTVASHDKHDEVLLHLARGAMWLLQNYRAGNELSELQMRYLQLATKFGFITGSGRVKWKGLIQEFRRRFPEQLMQKLQCVLPEGSSDHWIARILRRARAVQAPIRHLLLMEFLEITPEGFFMADLPTKILRDHAWVCDNPVCPGAGRATIANVAYGHSYEHRRPVRTCTCPACGRITCRIFTQDGEINWIRDFGPTWEQCLANLWVDSTVSVRQIARRLGVDSLTVKRHAAKAGLMFPRIGKRIAGKNGAPVLNCRRKLAQKLGRSDLVRRQQEWCASRRQNPFASATELRARAPGCYAYLYRHDPAWLLDHSPTKRPARQAKARVNWLRRDGLLSKRVFSARHQLLSEPGRPKQISISALGRRMRALAWITKHAAKLPLTTNELSKASESRIEFALRRIAWAAKQLRNELGPIKPWRLMEMAGLRNDLRRNPDIRRAIHRHVSGSFVTPPDSNL